MKVGNAMKKLIITLILFILINFYGCTKNKPEVDNTKPDINNLFTEDQEIDSITTMRVDTVYTLDTEDFINEFMKLLEDNTYTEFDNKSINKNVNTEITGSRSNGVTITLHYKDGLKRELDMYSELGVNYIDYTEIYEKPYEEITNSYTAEKNIWYDVLIIMLKGTYKDLNIK